MIKFISKESAQTFTNKTILLRIDLNINPEKNSESLRLDAIIPTIQFLLKYGSKIVLLSHKGRPKNHEPELSLEPFAPIISQKIGEPVVFTTDFSSRANSKITLLENLRFDPREEKNDKKFARKLADLGDIFVNDAFAVSHRKNASVAAITKYLPSYGGLLLEKEIENLDRALNKFERPLTLIIGGVKVEDKTGILNYFKKRADNILIGGSISNLFLSKDKSVKKYLKFKNIVLPEDTIGPNAEDIGPKTIVKFTEIISRSKTVIWNGPMGKYENENFVSGTKAIWQAIIENKAAFSVIGGGETTSSARLISGLEPKISSPNIFISTGGGAMLEYLSGKKLPGIEMLKKK